jgi:hypothetical protein
MEFQFLDFYCLDLVYEIEIRRHRLSTPDRADADQRQPPRRRRLLPMISNLVATLRPVPGSARRSGI